MKFVVITHVQHIKEDNRYFGYAPYVREMNIWFKYVDEVIVVAPMVNELVNPIHSSYVATSINFKRVPEFSITSVLQLLKTLFQLPLLFYTVYHAMQQADHIHLRCPGNMGLIGALVQILFPNTPKTAKYAGNWDSNAKQPWSYRMQKWLLSNTFLTRNMQVLVYGEWPNQTKNVKPFFTATYSEDEIMGRGDEAIGRRGDWETGVKFLFVGTLSKGKQPLYAIQLVEELHKRGKKVTLDLFGEGILRKELENYIGQNSLQNIIRLKGNQTKETVLKAYQSSHFLILSSKSEGWPKVVAEAMFWGCVPLASPVSCVPYMLGNGSRGLLLTERLSEDVNQLVALLHYPKTSQKMSNEGQNWSRQFTTDKFEAEIKKLLR